MKPTDCIGDDVRLYRADALEVLPLLDRSAVAAVVSDPPYGMDWDTDTTRFSGGHNPARRGVGRNDGRRVAGDDRPFDPTPWLVFPKVVLWGYQHFAAAVPVGSVFVWVKRYDEAFGSFLSDAELAWVKGGRGVYCHRDLSMNAEAGRRVHPTQKPTGLMSWCLKRLRLPAGATVLDPYMGSGTVGVAAMRLGLRYVGIELDPGHYETARKRLVTATGCGPGQLFSGLAAGEPEGGR